MGKGNFNEQTSIDYYEISKEIISYWNTNKIFEKSIKSRPENKIFPFYEGPPSANGMPGIHHVMARTIKDIFVDTRLLKVIGFIEKVDGILTDFLLNFKLKKN